MKKRREPGGPKKARLHEKQISLGLTQVQYFIIRQRAQDAGMKIVVYIRHIAISGQIVARLTEEERGLFKQLVQMSNDIHQLANKAQKGGAMETMLYFMKYGDIIDSLINRFSNDQ